MNFKDQVFLCMDSACGAGSVAVFVRGKCVAYAADEVSGTQAKNLIPMTEKALSTAGVTYADIDAIVSTIGPGSFTGIRIALSAARAFGLALNIPVFGVSTLACVAFAKSAPPACGGIQGGTALKDSPPYPPVNGGDIVALLNAGKGEAFVQAFDAQMHPLCEPHMLPVLEVVVRFPNRHYVGQVHLIPSAPPPHPSPTRGEGDSIVPSATMAGELLLAHPAFALAPEPLYIRAPDAKLPSTG